LLSISDLGLKLERGLGILLGMANAKDLRRRIRSVKNTAQITKAMQMVSATKMRRAQNQALGGRPYAQTLSLVLSWMSGDELPKNKLLEPNEAKKSGILLLTSDKGLCGALNTNVMRKIQAADFGVKNEEMVFYTVGKKGRDFVVRTGRALEADFENTEVVHAPAAIAIRKLLVADFLAGKVKDFYILYPQFISTLRQELKPQNTVLG
jgi:F-type H+-transporting ATPase subunit gamma